MVDGVASRFPETRNKDVSSSGLGLFTLPPFGASRAAWLSPALCRRHPACHLRMLTELPHHCHLVLLS
ncbi:hypothetical protein E2C01_017951 [Portunus trituberculatus]|uniref:Uncharacterized protein n=1 Tax=Portunus trituberculatus TaxID=210409 RepID=A0A5B7DUW9_PORTR|nr:hypothetical protein [Portunus trituberculatus]